MSKSRQSRQEGVLDRFYASCFRKNNRTQPEHFNTTLHVTNKQSKYRLSHGHQFRTMLEPRDQILEHDFDFTFEINSNNWNTERETLAQSQGFDVILKNIKKFLVEASSNVISVAFKFLNEGQLEGSEAKQYASKNIMVNVQVVFHQLLAAIQKDQVLMPMITFQQLRQELAIQVDNILNNILVNLADSYPVAPPSGGTQRMREVINEVNRIYDQQNDFIYTSGIKISDFITYKEVEGDQGSKSTEIVFNEERYTLFIMTVIDQVILVTQKSEEDSRERSVKEIFTEFNEHLFWLVQQKKYQQMVNKFDLKRLKNDPMKITGHIFQKDWLNLNISNYFNRFLERNQEKLKAVFDEMNPSEDDAEEGENIIRKQKQHPDANLLRNLAIQSEEGVLNMHKDKNFALGQKIPAFVKPFSKQEMLTNTFTVKHSSVLRVLTKWAQYLEDIFHNPQQIMNSKLYPFKNFDNKLIDSSFSSLIKSQLVKRLEKQYKTVKQKFQLILKSNFSYIGQFLCGGTDQFISNVNRYAQTRILSTKISSVLTSLMTSYICDLIHHLLLAGYNLDSQFKKQALNLSKNNNEQHQQLNVNLIVFRVSDLLRSKIQCSENSFITLLKTFYLLDDCEEMNGRFKLVRIKNKLDDSTNNVMVNYLFLGKIQCQLQISIQEAQGKAKNYNNISHFVYQLVRGKYGSITELAIMISQLDSMITACKEVIYVEKSMKRLVEQKAKNVNSKAQKMQLQEARNIIEQQPPFTSKELVQSIKNNHFQCQICGKVAIKQNRGIFTQTSQRLCNLCITKDPNFQSLYRDSSLRSFLCQQSKKGNLKRCNTLKLLKKVKGYVQCLYVNENGKLDYCLVIEVAKDQDWYFIKLFESDLDKVGESSFDFENIFSFSVNNIVKNGFNKGTSQINLIYFVTPSYQFPQDLCQFLRIPYKLIKIKTKPFVQEFLLYRAQTRIIRNIKFKSEIIQVSDDQQQWDVYDKTGRLLVLGEISNKLQDRIRYKKYDSLHLLNIKKIEVLLQNIQIIPSWLRTSLNLKILNLSNNNLKNITKEELPSRVNQFIASNNQLTSVDLSQQTRLMRLDLSNNKLASIDLYPLINLQHLSLGMNCLNNVDLSSQKKMMTLLLFKLNLTEIDLSSMPQLQVIDLSHNQLQYIDFTNNQILREINLQHNQFERFTLGDYGELTTLKLEHNPVTKIKLNNLRNLSKFGIRHTNTLVNIEISNMFNLKEIKVDDNQLETLELTNLPQIELLDMNRNPLQNLTLMYFDNLKKLEYQGGRIQRIKIYGMPKMTELALKKCQISSIDITTLHNLQYLDLSHNQLNYLTLGGLVHLKSINLSHNKLPQINLIDQIQLQKIIISDNQLTNLHFTYQEALIEADVSNNRLQNLYLVANQKLKVLRMNKNAELKMEHLPEALESLVADYQTVQGYDFGQLKKMKDLRVEDGEGRKQLKNVRQQARIRNKSID